MSTIIKGRRPLTDQLVRAARGQWSAPPTAGTGRRAAAARSAELPPLPCFPLKQHHFGQLAGAANSGDTVSHVATPSDFHSYLCNKIKHAQERVVLASLYIGVGSNANLTHKPSDDGTAEDQFLQALQDAASRPQLEKIQVLLDANRALRKVSFAATQNQSRHVQSNSAEAVHSRIDRFLDSTPTCESSGMYLFPVNDKRLCAILPSPLDEVAGVFHIKLYIVDDELILSGANLSEEYFSNRLDRYMVFTNGGGGLVDFYADLCDILCEYAIRYDGAANANGVLGLFSSQDGRARKEKLEQSLMQLFNGKNQVHSLESKGEIDPSSPIVAYAIPTFQMPRAFLGRPLRMQNDSEVARNLLSCTLSAQKTTSVRVSSAYLNLTPKLLAALTLYGKENEGAPLVLTAGLGSHGFAPKSGSQKQKAGIVDRIKATVPEAFMSLVKEAANSISACGGKILLYERPGWTFHAKGIWITQEDTGGGDCPETIGDQSSLLATIIGSGNYGARSEDLDVESNCIIVFANQHEIKEGRPCPIKEHAAAEWNNMCESSTELTDVKVADDKNSIMRFVLDYMRRFL